MENLGRMFNHIFREVRHRGVKKGHELGLGQGEMRTLVFISRNPGTTQHEICERFGINKAATARQCASLEEKGLIRREENRSDGRSKLLYQTEKALLMHKDHHSNEDKIYDSVLEVLSKEEKEELSRLLSKICEAIPDHKGGRS